MIAGQLLGSTTVALAPMSGVSDVAFRRIAMRFGAGLVVTEMVGSASLLRQDAEARLRCEGVGISPHVVQLVGRDPATMGDAARLAEASGADAIDINLGCPAKRVTGGLAGSALMREPGTALAIVEAVVAAVRVPVTVKMRLGWDEASLNAAVIASESEKCGAAGFTVHGRTRQQFYTGTADWEAIRPVVSAVARPVTANGDVLDLASARRCLARSGATSVMIGRAAVGQPWLIGAVAAGLRGEARALPGAAERRDAAIEHYEALLSLYGRDVGSRHARKHLAAYADRAAEDGWGLADVDRQALVTAADPARVVSLLCRLFEEPQRWAA